MKREGDPLAPVERKVQASTAAAAVSGLALWILGRYIFKGSVPDVVASWVYVVIPSAITFMAGYAARHTPRPVPPAWAAKTLIPPAAAAVTEPPAAAGPQGDT